MSPARVEEEARDVVVVDEVHERLARRDADAAGLRRRSVVRRARPPRGSRSARCPSAASRRARICEDVAEDLDSAARSRRRCRASPGLRVAAEELVVAVERLAEHEEVVLALRREALRARRRRTPARTRARRASPCRCGSRRGRRSSTQLRVRVDHRRAHLGELGRDVLQAAGEVAERALRRDRRSSGCGRSRGTRARVPRMPGGGTRLIDGSWMKMIGARPAWPSDVNACTPRGSQSGSYSVMRVIGDSSRARQRPLPPM